MAAKSMSQSVGLLLKPSVAHVLLQQSLGKCIVFSGSWFTPSEFVGKKWRQSIMHLGKPLSEYNLSCSSKQGANYNTHAVDSQVNLSHGHSSLGHIQGTVRSASPSSHSVSSPTRPLPIISVLAFVCGKIPTKVASHTLQQ